MHLDQNRQKLPYRTQEKKVGGLYWKIERFERKKIFVNVSKMAYMLKIGKVFHVHS